MQVVCFSLSVWGPGLMQVVCFQRAEVQARSMDAQQYLEFSEARQASFSEYSPPGQL